MRHKLFSVVLLALACALAAAPVLAQSDRGSITGTVTDPTGAVVNGAKVTATSIDTGQVREATTSESGSYTLPELRAGLWRVNVEAQGFKTASADQYKVAVQVTHSLDFTLEVGAVADVVTVTGDTNAAIQSDTPVRQTNVNERQVRELPLQVSAEIGGRTPLAFIFLDSNVTAGGGANDRGTNATNFRVSGGQGLGTEILIDGASTRRAQNGSFFSEVAPGPNAFQEFTVSTSTYSAEYGASSGGVVNFTTKSGSNEFHGEVYELFRNEALNANTYLNNLNGIKRPLDRQNDFGFNVGGPIYLPRFGEGGPHVWSGKNRAFFFFNYEGYRFTQSETVDLTVPTARMRAGDFGELLTDPYVVNNLGGPVRIYDPTIAPELRTPIPNNDVRAYRNGAIIDPAGFNILQLFPLPNQTGPQGSTVFRNYRATSQRPTNMNQFSTKFDVDATQRQHITFSYSFRKQTTIQGFGGRPPFPRFPASPGQVAITQQDVWDQSFRSQIGRFQHDFTISPTLINHFNLGYTRYVVRNRNFGEGIIPSSLGFPAGATQNTTFPRIGFPGYGSLETSPDPRAYQDAGSTFFTDKIADNTLQVSDFMTHVRGRHTLKFGGDMRFQQLNVAQGIDPGGTFNFRHDQTASAADPNGGWPIASLITGATEFSFVTIRGIDPGWRYFYPAFFVTDDIKVTQKLTLNLGVRYEIPYPREEARGRYRSFDPTVINPVAGRPGALVSASGEGGGPRAANPGLVETDYSNIGPRVGFAYSLNDRTVVRGGAGLYYAPILYGQGGGNTIEATQGYSTGAVPNGVCPDAGPYFPTCRRPLPGNNQQARFFLSSLPPYVPTDPAGQFIGSNVDYFDQEFRTGRTFQYSLDLQRELPYNFITSIGYIGHRATRLRSNFGRLNAVPLNALKLGYPLLSSTLASALANPAAVSYAQSVGVPLPSSPNAVYPGFNGTVAQALRPYPQYGNINNILESRGRSWYNAMQAKLERRFAQGIQFGASYTFSKLITDASEDLLGGSPLGSVVQNPYDIGQLRSVSPNHPYHVFVVNYLIELPFGRGRRFLNRGGIVDKLVGGFQLSGIHRYQSGLPLVVFDTEPGRTDFLNLVGFNSSLRPNLSGQEVLTGVQETGGNIQVVNIGAFSAPLNYQTPPTTVFNDPNYASYYANPLRFFGTAPAVLDKARVFPFSQENISILKKTPITENVTLEVGAEAFNLFNRHRYFLPDLDLRSSGFGRSGVISDVNVFSPRVIQLRARVIF